jgi:arylsulfatase A-like enzyme
VGHVDLAPTFCAIAGVETPEWMQGHALPADDAEADRQRRTSVVTEWDSEHARGEIHLRSIYRDGWLCTAYGKGSFHDGTEGELYDLADDPLQRANRWDDRACTELRGDLVAELDATLPAARDPRLECVAPV